MAHDGQQVLGNGRKCRHQLISGDMVDERGEKDELAASGRVQRNQSLSKSKETTIPSCRGRGLFTHTWSLAARHGHSTRSMVVVDLDDILKDLLAVVSNSLHTHTHTGHHQSSTWVRGV